MKLIKVKNNTDRINSIPKAVTVKWTDETGVTQGHTLLPDGRSNGALIPAPVIEVPDTVLVHPTSQQLMAKGDIKIIQD